MHNLFSMLLALTYVSRQDSVMQKLILFIITYFVLSNVSVCAQVRIILTAALADRHYELRKEQYIESFNLLYGYGYENVYVVESLKKQGPTFLDDYSYNVFYSHANNPSLLPGYNESVTLLDALYHFNFDPDDIIIKLTGRHHFVSDEFLRYVEKYQLEADMFVKVQNPRELHTIAFGMRCKYLIQMCEWFNKIFPTIKNPRRTPLEMLENSFVRPLEQKGIMRVHYVEKLGVRARLHGSTTAPDIEDRYVYR